MLEYSWPGNVRELENVIERCVVTGTRRTIEPDDLPSDVRSNLGDWTRQERRSGKADELYKRIIEQRESFWTVVYPLYMQREISRGSVRDLIRKGLKDARGNYRIEARMFNMEDNEYKRFLNFLRKHDCQVPFKEFRE